VCMTSGFRKEPHHHAQPYNIRLPCFFPFRHAIPYEPKRLHAASDIAVWRDITDSRAGLRPRPFYVHKNRLYGWLWTMAIKMLGKFSEKY